MILKNVFNFFVFSFFHFHFLSLLSHSRASLPTNSLPSQPTPRPRPLRAAAPGPRRGPPGLLGALAGDPRVAVALLGAARGFDQGVCDLSVEEDQRALSSFRKKWRADGGARGAVRGAERGQGPFVRAGRGG